MELTKGDNEDKNAYMQSFETKTVEALVAKLADRFCNVTDFLQDSPDYALKIST